ncbi:MFS transporter [Catenulispora sp. NF23]|uniref:MFS transporter n=1 Tax=Catenulispora pinistramenti TaxID=2705254 RepID=UPI001BAA1CA0|nr:MFS transporter [Catenulispora pinistramenti]MBS2536104.1 MFS transporter [Catenulispora pinistramenti]
MTAIANRAALPRQIPAIRNPQYLRLLGGATMSALGDQFWYVALAYAAVRAASPAAAGVVLSVSSIPRLLLVLFGGVIVDRFDARKLMIGSDALRAVVCLAAAALVTRLPGLGLLAVVAVVFGIVDALFLPASVALRPRLLEPHQYSGGAVLWTLSGRLALTVGAPLGGLVAASAGLGAALMVDAVSFVVSVTSLVGLRSRAEAGTSTATDAAAAAAAKSAARKEPFGQSFVAGLRYITHHPVLGPYVLWLALTNIGMVGPLNVGAALLATRRGWGAPGMGLLLTGFGVGAAVGAVVMGKVRIPGGLGTWLVVAGVIQGMAGAAMGLAPGLAYAVAAAGAVGVLSSAMGVPATVVMQTECDDAFRGRVGSVTTLISLGIVPLTMGLMGVAVGLVGVSTAFVLSGSVEALALVCLLSRSFRTVRAPQ